ncbi:MAG: tRNA 4-thiouridine(8) synthase ThiI [Candidatus Gracilibacteria bacterium]|nr:tRNA 4-thiouridine(8) synthase ThiI [Candidatus Gracilibacteria bacterium]
MKYIIRLFPEITIKSKPVRQKFIKKLYNNLNKHLELITVDFDSRYFWDKIEVDVYDDRILDEVELTLSRVPGIAYISKVKEYDLIDFDDCFLKVKETYEKKLENKTFVVRVKRAGTHAFTSIDLERYIGGGINQHIAGTKVKLKNPEITISLEIKDDKFYLIDKKIEGIGGYPVGVQNKALSLISGGFDSPVASFLMAKRGIKVDYLFFNLGGIAHEIGVKQITHYIWKTFSPSYKANFVTVDFEEVIKELLTNVNHKYRGVILKRLMFMVANKITEKYGYEAIITGEALGQVSSQTLTNLDVITKASNTLVLRPLIASDKDDIINISKKIGTYDYSASMPEYCGVISDKPSTAAKLEDVLAEEEKLVEGIIERAFENRKTQKLVDLLDDIGELDIKTLEEVNLIGEGEIVIDLREENNIKKSPLRIDETKKLEIPFYEINIKFRDLDKEKTYLFYCDKGVLSKMHGLYLKEHGYDNIKIYRP